LRNIEDYYRIKNDILSSHTKLKRLRNALNSLESIEKEIITLKYIEGFQWNQITGKILYSERMCFRYLNKGIEKLTFVFYAEKGKGFHL